MDNCNSYTLLKSKSLKVTAQRVEILDAVIRRNQPFSVSELHSELNSESNIDLATVYRFINQLAKSEIIREVVNTDGYQFYELACEHHPLHPHFICEKCKHITCLKNLAPVDAINLGSYTGSHCVRSISLNFSGVCSECHNHNSPKENKS